MFPVSPIFRLSIGLILLTVSLLLIGDLLGLLPDQARAEHKARKTIAETLAVQVSANLSEGRVEAVTDIVLAIQARNSDVLSAALRSSEGRLVAVAGEHGKHWDPELEDRSTLSHVQVPIHDGNGLWGRVEVSFRPVESFWSSLVSGRSVITIILFIALAGFAAYWLFLKRALNELDPSAVVPDRVRAALDALAEGLVIVDKNARIVLTNSSFERKVGEQNTAITGSLLSSLHWRDEANEEIEDDAALPWQQLLDTGELPSMRQMALVTASRQRLSFAVNCSPVRAPDESIRGVVVTFDDLTELEHSNAELKRAMQRLEQSQREITRQNRELHVLATRDPLTGALNRRSFFEGMNALIAECEANGEPISVIMADIDHFKSINDRFGHATGDKVIKLLAEILTNSVRTEDLVGRYGGEEFCIALPGLNESHAAEIAEQIRLTVHDGKSARFTSAVRISSSFGVAMNDGSGLTASALVDLADKALYQAKETGRNRVVCWSQLGDVDDAAECADSQDHQPEPASDSVEDENTVLQRRVLELEEMLAAQSVSRSAHIDTNTGLPNRLVLIDRIGQSLQRSLRAGTRMAVLCVDVDAINLVRTTQGLKAAEKLTKMVGARLRHAVRSEDTVAVAGADGPVATSISSLESGEFVVLLADMDRADSATWVTQRIFSAMEEVIDVDGNQVLPDARIGVSVFPDDADDAEEMLSAASAALREAQAVRDREVCLFFSKSMNARAEEQLSLQTQMMQAIDRGEFYLEYQPGVDVQAGRIVGVEALLRWRHPERGVLRPDIFIPIAEQAGLIDRLGEWVFETAATQLKEWHMRYCDDLTMSVNFSALQFRRKDLAERVIAKIDEIGLEPRSLVAEITETALIQNLDTAVAVVEDLSKAGLLIALDDFGTGYSSLSYLKRFPIDIVKIDRSFLRDFPSEAHDTEIVSAIIAIAHNLGLRVVAEGVEAEHQFKVLRNLQCDEIQGYLFSEPLSGEDASELLSNPSRIRRLLHNLQADDESSGGINPAIAGVINMPARHGLSASR